MRASGPLLVRQLNGNLLRAARGQYIPTLQPSFGDEKQSSTLSNLLSWLSRGNRGEQEENESKGNYEKQWMKPLRCFPLHAHHFKPIPPSAGNELAKENISNGGVDTSSPSPSDFHSYLCSSIRNAKKRVKLASLYIGPAGGLYADPNDDVRVLDSFPPSTRLEMEFLQSLQHFSSKHEQNVELKILLDFSRAMRRVKTLEKDGEFDALEEKSRKSSLHDTTSSAEAVCRFIHSSGCSNDKKNRGLFLFPAVDEPYRSLLPSPLNEVAGVFHLKAYVIDDELILSGANLSQEYFNDRFDRYLLFTDGANGLVDFYADLIDILSDYAYEFKPGKNMNGANTSRLSDQFKNFFQRSKREEQMRKKKLAYSLSKLFDGSGDMIPGTYDRDYAAKTTCREDKDKRENTNSSVCAYAVPTFQVPLNFFSTPNNNEKELQSDPETRLTFLSDAEIIRNILLTALEQDSSSSVRISSAYLNPTPFLMSALTEFGKRTGKNSFSFDVEDRDMKLGEIQHSIVCLLTAGEVSHGFAPKRKIKNSDRDGQGRNWIPSAYSRLVKKRALDIQPNGGKVLLYEREGQTFHAKGLWLTAPKILSKSKSGQLTNDILIKYPDCSLLAAVVGSGNFGSRSENLDFESNCVLIMNKDDNIQPHLALIQEWNNMCYYAKEFQFETGRSGCKRSRERISDLFLDELVTYLRKFL